MVLYRTGFGICLKSVTSMFGTSQKSKMCASPSRVLRLLMLPLVAVALLLAAVAEDFCHINNIALLH